MVKKKINLSAFVSAIAGVLALLSVFMIFFGLQSLNGVAAFSFFFSVPISLISGIDALIEMKKSQGGEKLFANGSDVPIAIKKREGDGKNLAIACIGFYIYVFLLTLLIARLKMSRQLPAYQLQRPATILRPSQHVNIHGRPKLCRTPHSQHQSPFKNKTIGVSGLGEPIEKPLHGVILKQFVELPDAPSEQWLLRVSGEREAMTILDGRVNQTHHFPLQSTFITYKLLCYALVGDLSRKFLESCLLTSNVFL